MTQKHLVILILLIIIIGLVVSGLGFVKSNFQASLNPDPTPAQDTESMNEQNQTNPESLSVQGQSSSSLSGVVKEPSPPNQKPKKTYSQPPKELPTNQILNQKAVIETDRGIIEFEFYPEATKAASNFIFLAKDGFYDGLTFHRIEPGFVIQGGDPLGNGQGGPGYTFADEPVSRAYTKGVVAMANRGPDTNGSQFFIVLANTQLPPKYTIFGNVIQGKEILDNIKIGDVMRRVSIQPLVKN